MLAALATMLCTAYAVSAAPQQKTADAYRIEVQISGAAQGTKVVFSPCIDLQFARTDSSATDANGKVLFAGKEPLPSGMYSLSVANNDEEIVIDFFISDNAPQQFVLSFDKNEGMHSLQINGSPENALFFENIKYATEKQNQLSALQARMQALLDSYSPGANADSITALEKRIGQLSNDIQRKWSDVQTTFKGSTLALFFRSAPNPEAPEPNIPPTAPHRDSLVDAYYNNFYTYHFFDNIDFSDLRTLRLPVLLDLMNTYFTQVLHFEKDTLMKGCDILFEKARTNREIYEFVVRNRYDFFRTAPYPELENIANYIAERYVVNDKEAWADVAYVSRLEHRVKMSKLNPPGQLASDLHLQDTAGKAISLYETESPYTILYFYNPGCHTCALITPRLWNIYNKYRHKGLQVIAVYVDTNKEEWTSYLAEKKYNWINAWKPENNEELYERYDLHAIPSIYVLDKNKKVVQRDIFIDFLDDVLNKLTKK